MLNFLKLRLFPKFLILLVCISVIPVAYVGWIIVDINDDSLQSEVQRYHLDLASNLAEKVDERLNTLQSQLDMVISAFQDPTVTWPQRQLLLSSLINSSNYFGIISAVSTSGQELMKVYHPEIAPEIHENPELISHAKKSLFVKFQNSDDEAFRVWRKEDNTFAELYMPFQTPIGKSAIYVKVTLSDLMNTISDKEFGQTGFSYFVGQNGKILSEIRQTDLLLEEEAIIKTALVGNKAATEFTDSNGDNWVGASAPVKRLGGAIITQQRKAEAYAASIDGKRKAAIFVLLTIIIAVLAAYFLARSFTKPLLAISQTLHQVDLSAGIFPSPVKINSRDEIQDMAQTFNQMIEKLRGYAELQVEKLIIEQKKTEAILFSIDDGIIMTDYQGRIQLISQSARNILKLEPDLNALGQALWKFLPSPDLKSAFMEVLMKPEDKKSVEVKLPRDNKESIYQLSSEQVRTPNRKETLGVVTVLHDITLEKELDSMKEEFLHSITHDLRNPLTAIRGFIRLFQSGQTGPTNEVQNKMLSTMDKASLRLLNMVNDILDLARLDTGKLKLHVDDIKVDDIAKRVVDLFAPQALSNGIKLDLQVVNEPPPEIKADPNLIERVFTNLIGNATKFTPDGGTITAFIETHKDHIRCAIKDTGDGIPPDYLDKVFDKFRQVEGNYKGGAGLGLTICQRIVVAHGGKIWVESKLGEGAAFIFTIPRDVGQNQSEEGKEKAA